MKQSSYMSNTTLTKPTLSDSSEINTILNSIKPSDSNQINILIGKQNDPLLLILNKIGHLLIAGWADSKKINIVDTILISLMAQYSYLETQFILCDNTADLYIYGGKNPYLLTEIINDQSKFDSALKWTVYEIDHRFKLFQKQNVRDIDQYNSKSDQKLSHIVFVIKSLDTFMDYDPKYLVYSIQNILIRGKQAGVHLIIISDLVTNDALPKAIQTSLPTRIICKVTSRTTAARIGAPEAHLLSENEFYLTKIDESPQKITMIDVNGDTHKITEYIKSLPYHDPPEGPKSNYYREDSELDPLFEDAVKIISQYDKASASLIQRRLKLGYARASRLLDELEAKGYVAPAEGSKPRLVLKKT